MKLRLIANGSSPEQRRIRRWGLSFMIDDDILFDAFGDARVLMDNLHRFKVDIGRIAQVVVSHEHWDHVEGLQPLLAERPGLRVYLPAHVDVSLKDKVRSWGGDIVEVGDPLCLKPHVHLSGEIIGQYAGRNMPEQSLVIESSKGLIVVAGCAHPGIILIVQNAQQIFQQPVHGVIGGFHLKDNSSDDLCAVAADLKKAGVAFVVPLHCTGLRAVEILGDIFGAGCLSLCEGQEIEIL